MSKTLAEMKKNIQQARLVGANLGNRHKDDFYATPAAATEALLHVEKFEGAIWEPACGDGAITKVLKSYGHQTISSDLVDRGYGDNKIDFLMEYCARAPNIITNPPFKLATEFVAHALTLTTGKVAMLLKVGFLEGVGRGFLFDESPFARLWVFRNRQTFFRNGDEPIKMNGAGGMIAYGWFVWEHGYKDKPTLGWISTNTKEKRPRQLTT